MNEMTDESPTNNDELALIPGSELAAPDGDEGQSGFERDDNRWRRKGSWRDWGILLLLILIYLTWAGIIFFLEPGIR